ncbi:MAG: hypothetical protein KC506_02520, partial [Nanoarchaeota archaeon]|nr:hypothetical protein [Nanoarchaeota archaeon]
MGNLGKFLGITVMSLAFVGCEKPRAPTSSKTVTSSSEITATTEYKYDLGENFPSRRSLRFSATKKGAYLIEGWKGVYRGRDQLDKIVTFDVDEL